MESIGDLGGLDDLPDLADFLDADDGMDLDEALADSAKIGGLHIPDPFGTETHLLIEDFDWLGEYELYVHDWDPQHFDGVGDPVGLSDFWFEQQGPASCAVATQTMVLESITGSSFDEAALSELAEDKGWFDPEIGTYPEAVGLLLEHHGVQTQMLEGADIQDIVSALERGDHVLVGVNSNEIWTPLRDVDGLPVAQQVDGHSVWVTGVDQTPDGSYHVILNDPGGPDGQMMAVALEDFLRSWQSLDNHLVIAQATAGASR